MNARQRRLDDRIRAACLRLIASNGDFEASVQEFLTLVHQKSERLKRRAARLLLNGKSLEDERRKSYEL